MNKGSLNNQNMDKYFFRASAEDLKKIPGSPIGYWAGSKILDILPCLHRVGSRAVKGLDTNGKIEYFLKRWFEISCSKFKPLEDGSDYWYPIAKGGRFRRWYGNYEYCINYQFNGRELKNNKANLRNADYYFCEGLTWTVVSSGGFAVRYMPRGFLFDQGGSGIFLENNDSYSLDEILGSLNSTLINYLSKLLCPTLNFTTGDVRKFSIIKTKLVATTSVQCIYLSKVDWDFFEISWDFTSLPLLQTNYTQSTMQSTYKTLRSHWLTMTQEMQQLEEENNRIFIEAYGLEDELTPDVPLKEITLTCNPHYRYGGKKSDAELEKLLLANTMKEYISYAVGCMLGRYSLEKEGLILANQGDTLQEYLTQVSDPKFMPDEDNVIPILDDNWFVDDIVDRFYAFLRVTFGTERFNENVQFIEDAIGKSIRNFFVTDFYTDHVKRYKKRPIYWMFSSPKGSFNVLIYMHRYNEGTVSTILNKYLREFQNKLKVHEIQLQEVSESSTARQGDKTKALKEIQRVRRTLDEILQWERNVIYPLATQRITIDLDDGVKVNYQKFGAALKKIAGLN